MLHIHSKAPTRIDLCGGTVDIWPIYLLLDNPVTINVGISLFAETEIKIQKSSNPTLTLLAEDQGFEKKLSWSELKTFTPPPQLELHTKLLRHFVLTGKLGQGSNSPENYDVTFLTRAKSPAGAGLGGSSALSVSMIQALGTWANGGRHVSVEESGYEFIDVIKDIETTVIRVPAGLQDYFGAMYGGLQSLYWKVGTHEQKHWPEKLLSGLEKRLMLFYSGQSRNSGINNWTLFKSFIDRDSQVQTQFSNIVAATQNLEKALNKSDWVAVGDAIAQEWQTRKGLAPGISTPEMDRAFELAFGNNKHSGKICGAGGGGCFFIYIPEADDSKLPALRKTVEERVLTIPGIKSLDCKMVPHGVHVTTTGSL